MCTSSPNVKYCSVVRLPLSLPLKTAVVSGPRAEAHSLILAMSSHHMKSTVKASSLEKVSFPILALLVFPPPLNPFRTRTVKHKL